MSQLYRSVCTNSIAAIDWDESAPGKGFRYLWPEGDIFVQDIILRYYYKRLYNTRTLLSAFEEMKKEGTRKTNVYHLDARISRDVLERRKVNGK